MNSTLYMTNSIIRNVNIASIADITCARLDQARPVIAPPTAEKNTKQYNIHTNLATHYEPGKPS